MLFKRCEIEGINRLWLMVFVESEKDETNVGAKVSCITYNHLTMHPETLLALFEFLVGESSTMIRNTRPDHFIDAYLFKNSSCEIFFYKLY